MGCGGSKGAGKRYREATKALTKIKLRLHIPEAHVKKLFKVFEKVDVDHSGEINLDEFFDLFELDYDTFGQKAFTCIDVSGEHRLDFSEFFVGLWNYCPSEMLRLLLYKCKSVVFASHLLYCRSVVAPRSTP